MKKILIDQDALLQSLPAYINQFIVEPDKVDPPATEEPETPEEPPVSTWVEMKPDKNGQILIKNKSNINIKVGAGVLGYISLDKCTNVIVDGSGADMKSGSIDITQCNGLELFGLKIHDQLYRAINIRGLCNDLYLHDISFKNIGNYVIASENQTNYDGTDKTVAKNWTFERLTFENTSSGFNCGSSYDDDGIKNLMKNFKFLNCTIKNCPNMGNVIWMGACDGYEVSGNTVDNINTSFPDKNAPNGYHNGIFHMWGNGSFHDNKVTNFQGNLIRAWGISYGKQVKDVLIYNNIAYNSRKYGAFELQATPEIQDYLAKYPNRINVTNAKVYNNTAGHLNTARDWEGQMLDLYNTGGTLEYYNNLGFEMNGAKAITNMINNMSDVKITQSNNKYVANMAGAVDANFKSLFPGIGAQ